MIPDATSLLKRMIAIPSPSRDEDGTAALLAEALARRGISGVTRMGNNVIARSSAWTVGRPTLLLNSHHDTVRPAASYTRNPYEAVIDGGRLYGLGSNDAGASVVSLIEVFAGFCDADLPVNLLLVLSAEEEVTGPGGIRAVLPELDRIDMGIVGEPTGMDVAIGERGLVVLDGEARGRSGHAARDEGVNALYLALDDIARLRALSLPEVSPTLGPVKITVTQIEAGTQHNVVPDRCRFVVDTRTTDAYTNEQTVDLLRAAAVNSTLTPRSTHISASAIDVSHPLVRAAVAAGAKPFVSPTTSDMSQMRFPAIKIGPGQSARSHSADEYVEIDEIRHAISTYRQIIHHICKSL